MAVCVTDGGMLCYDMLPAVCILFSYMWFDYDELLFVLDSYSLK